MAPQPDAAGAAVVVAEEAVVADEPKWSPTAPMRNRLPLPDVVAGADVVAAADKRWCRSLPVVAAVVAVVVALEEQRKALCSNRAPT